LCLPWTAVSFEVLARSFAAIDIAAMTTAFELIRRQMQLEPTEITLHSQGLAHK